MIRASFDCTNQNDKNAKTTNKISEDQITSNSQGERINLIHLCKDLKSSLSSGNLKEGFPAVKNLSEERTHASTTSGQASITNSPVFASLSFKEEVVTRKPAKKAYRKIKPAKVELKQNTKFFCMSSYKKAPKASTLPKLSF
mmetsp:Transcript_5833/g.6576  ORF Transcript_5833/g.6576 Transcript_5833/m.6576 type:complete len:142 (+) Transcript_5833:83-508(+)